MELKVGTFTHWNLSQREQLAGSILTTDQKAMLQNDLATIAEQKLNLEYDPRNHQNFVQQEAFLSGQMKVIRFMMDRSEESETALINNSRNLPDSQL